jgi:hypothetical protein
MALSPAKAATETWNFNQFVGTLGVTQNYTSSPDGLTATAAGFSSTVTTPNTAGAFNTPTALFGKSDGFQGGSLENGVGVAPAPGGSDSEILAGSSFIMVTLPTGVTNVMASLGSATVGESWQIFGSTTGAAGSWISVATGSDQDVLHSLQTAACAMCTFFAFFATGVDSTGHASDVLLSSITAIIANVPLPGALPLFATGMGLIGLLGMRRKRKVQVAT